MSVALDSSWLLALLLASTRILAWAMIAPPLATAGVPRLVKGIVSVALSLAVLPVVRDHLPAQQFGPIASALVVQVVLGASLGFLTRLVFTAVETAGGLIDIFGGFSLAAAYDPFTLNTNAVFQRFYAMLATTLIFVTNVHIVIIRGFLRTFDAIPLNSGFSMESVVRNLTGGVTTLFVSALQIAGPLIVVLFISDVALGVLNRIAPQLNAFAMSFPIKIGLTLMLSGLGFMLMPETITELASASARAVASVTS